MATFEWPYTRARHTPVTQSKIRIQLSENFQSNASAMRNQCTRAACYGERSARIKTYLRKQNISKSMGNDAARYPNWFSSGSSLGKQPVSPQTHTQACIPNTSAKVCCFAVPKFEDICPHRMSPDRSTAHHGLLRIQPRKALKAKTDREFVVWMNRHIM